MDLNLHIMMKMIMLNMFVQSVNIIFGTRKMGFYEENTLNNDMCDNMEVIGNIYENDELLRR